jgi:hypothetical protein
MVMNMLRFIGGADVIDLLRRRRRDTPIFLTKMTINFQLPLRDND